MPDENTSDDDTSDTSEEDSEEEQNISEGSELTDEEKEELSELRQKSFIQKSIDVLDEELKRKTKRNLREMGVQEEGENEEGTNEDKNEEFKSYIENERKRAYEDFIVQNAHVYSDPTKRKELSKEMKEYALGDKEGYSGYLSKLGKAHKILGFSVGEKKGQSDGTKTYKEDIISGAGGGKSSDVESKISLSMEQQKVIRNIPGMTPEKYLAQLKRDNTKK